MQLDTVSSTVKMTMNRDQEQQATTLIRARLGVLLNDAQMTRPFLFFAMATCPPTSWRPDSEKEGEDSHRVTTLNQTQHKAPSLPHGHEWEAVD